MTEAARAADEEAESLDHRPLMTAIGDLCAISAAVPEVQVAQANAVIDAFLARVSGDRRSRASGVLALSLAVANRMAIGPARMAADRRLAAERRVIGNEGRFRETPRSTMLEPREGWG